MGKLLCLCVLLFTSYGFAQKEALVIKNVSVVDVRKGSLQKNQIVVVQGNRIISVSEKVKFPKSAIVLDASGKYLIPGLWDMHVHSLTDSRYKWVFPLLIANGITGIRDMGTNLSFLQIDSIKKQVDQGLIVGPRITAINGHILDGANSSKPAARMGVSVPIGTVDEARNTVRKLKNQGADFIKLHDFISRDVYFAVAEEAKRQQLPLVGHVPMSMTASEVSDLGQRSIEHLNDLLISCSLDEEALRQELHKVAQAEPTRARILTDAMAVERYDDSKAQALFTRFLRNGTWLCPTLIVNRITTLPNFDDTAIQQRWKYIPSTAQTRLGTMLTQWVLPAADLQQRTKQFQKRVELVGKMSRMRIGILAGTDTPVNPFVPGFDLHEELALFIQAGLSPAEALQTATVNPAIFLQKEKEFGTIEKNKLADLVLLDANPLENITNAKRIFGVVVNGRLLRRPDLDSLLQQAEAEAKK